MFIRKEQHSRAVPAVALGLLGAAIVALVVVWQSARDSKLPVAKKEPPAPDIPLEGVTIPFDHVRLDDENNRFVVSVDIPGKWTECRTQALFVARVLQVRDYIQSGMLGKDYPDSEGRAIDLTIVNDGRPDAAARLLIGALRKHLVGSGLSLAFPGAPDTIPEERVKMLPDLVCGDVLAMVEWRRWKDGFCEQAETRVDDHRRSVKFGTLPQTIKTICLFTLFQPRDEDLARLKQLHVRMTEGPVAFAVRRLEPGPLEREFLIPRIPPADAD